MTETATPDVAPSPSRRRRWTLPLIAIVLVAAGLGVGLAIAAARDDDTSPANANPNAAAVELANITQACRNWASDTNTTGDDAAWCDDMTAWMNQRITRGQTTGPMMWGDPDQMLATCRSWASTSSVPTGTWCDNMVAWMRQHMNGNWNDWMMNSPMMDS